MIGPGGTGAFTSPPRALQSESVTAGAITRLRPAVKVREVSLMYMGMFTQVENNRVITYESEVAIILPCI